MTDRRGADITRRAGLRPPDALPLPAVPLLALRCDGIGAALAVCFLLLPQPDVASTTPRGRTSTAVEKRVDTIAQDFSPSRPENITFWSHISAGVRGRFNRTTTANPGCRPAMPVPGQARPAVEAARPTPRDSRCCPSNRNSAPTRAVLAAGLHLV